MYVLLRRSAAPLPVPPLVTLPTTGTAQPSELLLHRHYYKSRTRTRTVSARQGMSRHTPQGQIAGHFAAIHRGTAPPGRPPYPEAAAAAGAPRAAAGSASRRRRSARTRASSCSEVGRRAGSVSRQSATRSCSSWGYAAAGGFGHGMRQLPGAPRRVWVGRFGARRRGSVSQEQPRGRGRLEGAGDGPGAGQGRVRQGGGGSKSKAGSKQ